MVDGLADVFGRQTAGQKERQLRHVAQTQHWRLLRLLLLRLGEVSADSGTAFLLRLAIPG